MAFREKDYLKRQLAELARVLARALGLRDTGRIDEARDELEKGAVTAFGVGYTPLGAVDVTTALGLLRTREAAEAYAQLLDCDAELVLARGDGERAGALRIRAQAVRRALAAGGPAGG
jgi:hypothetical protein